MENAYKTGLVTSVASNGIEMNKIVSKCSRVSIFYAKPSIVDIEYLISMLTHTY